MFTQKEITKKVSDFLTKHLGSQFIKVITIPLPEECLGELHVYIQMVHGYDSQQMLKAENALNDYLESLHYSAPMIFHGTQIEMIED